MTKMLVALLALLVAGGAYNFHRNAKLVEQTKVPRPYKSLSTEQLDALFQAYTQEKTKLEKSLGKLEGQGDVSGSYAPSDLKGKLGGFERAQKQAARYNEVHSQVLDRDVELDRIKAERAIRQSGIDPDSKWGLFMRRLLTI